MLDLVFGIYFVLKVRLCGSHIAGEAYPIGVRHRDMLNIVFRDLSWTLLRNILLARLFMFLVVGIYFVLLVRHCGFRTAVESLFVSSHKE